MTSITGVVVSGKKTGRLLGFPTANIKMSPPTTCEPGIYAGTVSFGQEKYQAALYAAGGNILEAYLFDFSGDAYGQEVQVELLKKIREKQAFANDQEAINQITKDVSEIKIFFQHL